MIDVLIALVLLAAGYWMGRRAVPARGHAPKVEEREMERLREDRAAFSQLMGYNAGQAYGLHEE